MKKLFMQQLMNKHHKKKMLGIISKKFNLSFFFFVDKTNDICFKRVSPPVLPIQFGIRNEQMPILRQGIFVQFESSQKMNGVFVALLLRDVR